MMMGETQIAYLMLFTAPGMFAVNMLVARWMANEAPPVALAFWRWFGVLLLMLMLRGNQLWQNRHFVLGEWKDLLVLGILGMGICGAWMASRAASSRLRKLLAFSLRVGPRTLMATWEGGTSMRVRRPRGDDSRHSAR